MSASSQHALSVSFNNAEKLTKLALMKGLAVMLHGSPSSGKTAIGSKIAKQANLKSITFSLLDHEPTDICGLPDLRGEKATFKPFDTFPVEGDPLPEDKNGWLIMLDEFSSGGRAMQAAANKLLYERLVGSKNLHPNARVMAMGNLSSDNAFVVGMPQHTKSRQAHLFVHQDLEEWTDWALGADINRTLIAYVQAKPALLTKYDPDNIDVNYSCARTLEMASDALKDSTFERWMLPLIQGILGTGVGLEFYNFSKYSAELPTLKEIILNPDEVKIPTQQSYKFALALIISDSLNKDNAAQVMKFIERLSTDLQYFIFRAACRRNSALAAVPAIEKWATGISNKYCKMK